MANKKDDALDELKKGFSHLFRAAKSAAESAAHAIPTAAIEDVVMTSATEVGRAFVSVKQTVEKEVFGKKSAGSKRPSAYAGSATTTQADEAKAKEDAQKSDPDAGSGI